MKRVLLVVLGLVAGHLLGGWLVEQDCETRTLVLMGLMLGAGWLLGMMVEHIRLMYILGHRDDT